uniref:Uncharacterized protein n=1 Tax=Eptatretus burgeri TaxID=7764 RepID=A0A8C4QUA8_EPTBU
MLPAISKMFILNNLLAGTLYDLCVVAIYDDAATSLTATHILGCLQFSTDDEYIRCSSLPGDFIGGTMIIIIGGIIVFSLLVFIIILMIRYRVCLHDCIHLVLSCPLPPFLPTPIVCPSLPLSCISTTLLASPPPSPASTVPFGLLHPHSFSVPALT